MRKVYGYISGKSLESRAFNTAAGLGSVRSCSVYSAAWTLRNGKPTNVVNFL
jgi:hypothetical protein